LVQKNRAKIGCVKAKQMVGMILCSNVDR
jgi:hypothetical protein